MTMTFDKKTDESRSEDQARAQVASIVEMVRAMTDAQANDDDEAMEEARQIISEDALSVEVRSDWQQPPCSYEAASGEAVAGLQS